MKGAAEFILSLFELAEAEGRLFRANVERTGAGCVLTALGLLFIGGALAFIIAAIYSALKLYVPAPVALLIVAGCCLVVGLILVVVAKPFKQKHLDNDKKSG